MEGRNECGLSYVSGNGIYEECSSLKQMEEVE